MYQLSNQISLGISEKTAIENLKNITRQLIDRELNARRAICTQTVICDKIYRSEGTLKYARLISCDEALKCLSDIRMGVTAGLVKDISLETINRLFVEIRPATLMRKEGKKLESSERDEKRANLIRETLR